MKNAAENWTQGSISWDLSSSWVLPLITFSETHNRPQASVLDEQIRCDWNLRGRELSHQVFGEMFSDYSPLQVVNVSPVAPLTLSLCIGTTDEITEDERVMSACYIYWSCCILYFLLLWLKTCAAVKGEIFMPDFNWQKWDHDFFEYY